MPMALVWPTLSDVYLPLALTPQQWEDRAAHNYQGVGRLRTGITVHEAQAQLKGIADRLQKMVNDLLLLSRLHGGKMQLDDRPFGLKALASDALESLSSVAERAKTISPAGTRSAPSTRVISATLAPLPPSRSRSSREPSRKSTIQLWALSGATAIGAWILS